MDKYDNPFKPGFGRMPPRLAGREREQTILGRGLYQLLKVDADEQINALLLSGPRGLGKTVLLRWLREEAEKGGADVITTNAEKLSTPVKMVQILAPEVVDAARKDGFNVSVAGTGYSHTPGSPLTDPHWEALMLESLQKRQTPLLVTIDEGHTLPGEVVYALAHLTQDLLWERCPVWFVLAGTPGMPGHLSTAGVVDPISGAVRTASFFGRADGLELGLLSPEASGEAVEAPLVERDWTVEQESLAQVLEDAQCYPYFLQLWGAALWDAGVGQGRRLNAEVVKAARPVVDERRLALYKERFKEIYTPQGEIEGRKVLQAAAALAAICLESKEGKASIAHMSQVCKDLGLDDYGRKDLGGCISAHRFSGGGGDGLGVGHSLAGAFHHQSGTGAGLASAGTGVTVRGRAWRDGASSISPPPICSTPTPPSLSKSGTTRWLAVSFPRLATVSATPLCRANRKFSTLNAFPRISPCWSL